MVLHGFQGRGRKKRRLAAGHRRTSDCPEFAPRVGVIVQRETNALSIPGHRYVPRPREESQILTAQMRGDAANLPKVTRQQLPSHRNQGPRWRNPGLSRRPLPRFPTHCSNSDPNADPPGTVPHRYQLSPP